MKIIEKIHKVNDKSKIEKIHKVNDKNKIEKKYYSIDL